MTPPSLNQKGFTLIEMLVSITLLSIGLLSVAGMQTVALQKGTISYRISTASYLAREAMDDIMSWEVSNPKLNSDNTALVYGTPSLRGGGTFTITYTTQTNTPASGTTRIDVTVTDTAKGIHDVTLTSFKKVV